MTEVLDDLVVELLATGGPTARAGKLFDATAQSFETDDVGCLTELLTQRVAQAREKHQFKTFARIAGELAQVGFRDSPRRLGLCR